MPRKKKIHPLTAIHGYMLTHGSISRTTAITHFEVYDLPAVMTRLKRKGVAFTKSGTGKNLKYTLPEVANKFKKKPHQQPITNNQQPQLQPQS